MRISDIGIMELSGMEFHAFHGCLEAEKTEGNLFVVDFKAEYDLGKAAESDNLEDTVDYSGIYDLVKREMEIPSNLLENVAGRIADAIAGRYEFKSFSVKVSKRNPPVDGVCAWSSVTVFK